MARMRIEDLEIANADIYRTVLYHFPDIVHSVDNEGHLIYANRRAEEVLGYSAEELLTIHVRDLYPEDILANMREGFEELKSTGDKRVESVFLSRDGQRIPVEMRSFSVYDDNGEFLHTFSISRDLRALKRLQNDLIHAGRLAAIGEMASGIAHDINNPLQVIGLSSQLLETILADVAAADDEDMAQARQIGEDIQRASQTIEKLSNHLLDFSRKSAETYVPVDLRLVVEESLFMTQYRRKKSGVTVKEELGAGAARVMGSENQLEQVFINLISNACDAMLENEGPRELTIRLQPRQGGAEAFWSCEVSDTGCGVPEDALANIFKSFFTTKERGKGTGLGLSISRGIIDNHQGRINVTSTPGEGTTFTVLLPAADKTVG